MNRNIPINNIYYMLAYTYKTLYLSEYKNMGSEKFENVIDLYSELLLIGVPYLVKSGLSQEYTEIEEDSVVIRGKINLNESIKKNSFVNKKLIVSYDELSSNILVNQIIKATLFYLVKTNNVNHNKRKKLLSLLPYFSYVEDIELNINLWKNISYNRRNIRYQFVIDICRFLYEELLLSEGNNNIEEVVNDQNLASLFEKFVFAFYQKETPYTISSPQIKWNVDDGYFGVLPIMQTDIVVKNDNKTLIIDTKFYTHNMGSKYGGSKATHISDNLYQIYTYVNNYKSSNGEEVSGMLLYAKTKDIDQPNNHYVISGKKISVVCIDLDQDFNMIKKDLLNMLNNFISIKKGLNKY